MAHHHRGHHLRHRLTLTSPSCYQAFSAAFSSSMNCLYAMGVRLPCSRLLQCPIAPRISRSTLCSRQSPLLFHQRKHLSLWSLASIVKDKGALLQPPATTTLWHVVVNIFSKTFWLLSVFFNFQEATPRRHISPNRKLVSVSRPIFDVFYHSDVLILE
jgi:hypothetical protein